MNVESCEDTASRQHHHFSYQQAAIHAYTGTRNQSALEASRLEHAHTLCLELDSSDIREKNNKNNQHMRH